MNSYRYILDNSCPTRLFPCPQCEKREFKRYVDTKAGTYLPEHVGRCNREVNCGYHYTARQYQEEMGQRYNFTERRVEKAPERVPAESTEQVTAVPFDLFRRSVESEQGRERNNLVRYLLRCFHAPIAIELIGRYFIGSSNHWDGATVFWQIDRSGIMRGGKVMLYDPLTGKRNRERKPTWIHSLVEIPGYQLQQCFLGEHLLARGAEKRTVAVVESEKTAMIASHYLPEYVWLACGGLKNLSPERCRVLADCGVIFYPDLGGFDQWHAVADRVQREVGCRVVVSDLLEREATEADRSKGLDVADFLVRACPNYGWALSEKGYPLFWDGPAIEAGNSIA